MVDRIMPVGDEGAGWPTELPVEMDGGGEREDASGHPAEQSAGSPREMLLEAKLIFERV